MDTHAEQIRLTYGRMDTDELITRVKSGTLTEEAQVLALKELQSRGINTSELPEKPSLLPTSQDMPPGFFWRCWHGKEKLWKAFWLVGLLGGFLLVATKIPPSPIIQMVLSLVIVLPIQIVWWVSVWRCAFRASHWGWSVLARGVVILWVGILCLFIARFVILYLY